MSHHHFRRLALLRSLVLLSVCLASCTMKAQSPDEADANSRPAILGTLDKGTYSNRVIGFEIRLDPVCAIANEARAIERLHQSPQRLSLMIHCGDDTVMLSSFPLYPDEQADLRTQADPSLAGTVDGLEFSKRGDWQKMTTNGIEMLVQELAGRSDSDDAALGFYRAFLIGRRYVSILAIGPKEHRPQLSQIGTPLRIETSPAQTAAMPDLAIIAQETAFWKAYVDGNVADLSKLLLPDFTNVEQQIWNKDQVLTFVKQFHERCTLAPVRMVEPHVTFITPDIATVVYHATETPTCGTQPLSGETNISTVWLRRDGRWQMHLHTEFSVLPN